MIQVGTTARKLRETLGWTQRETAKRLGVSDVHLCNVEHGVSQPSKALLDRYKDLWGVDLYVFAWCEQGDEEALPPAVRAAASNLAKAWRSRIREVIEQHRKKSDEPCYVSDR